MEWSGVEWSGVEWRASNSLTHPPTDRLTDSPGVLPLIRRGDSDINQGRLLSENDGAVANIPTTSLYLHCAVEGGFPKRWITSHSARCC